MRRRAPEDVVVAEGQEVSQKAAAGERLQQDAEGYGDGPAVGPSRHLVAGPIAEEEQEEVALA